jgi:hypothetical protein
MASAGLSVVERQDWPGRSDGDRREQQKTRDRGRAASAGTGWTGAGFQAKRPMTRRIDAYSAVFRFVAALDGVGRVLEECERPAVSASTATRSLGAVSFVDIVYVHDVTRVKSCLQTCLRCFYCMNVFSFAK